MRLFNNPLFFTAAKRLLISDLVLVSNLSTLTESARLSSRLCSLVKQTLNLVNQAVVICLFALGPYWHKLPHLLLFSWTLFLHTIVGDIANQDSRVLCPDGYAIKLEPGDMPRAEGPRSQNKAVPHAANSYVACEDYDQYMESLETEAAIGNLILSDKSELVKDPRGLSAISTINNGVAK